MAFSRTRQGSRGPRGHREPRAGMTLSLVKMPARTILTPPAAIDFDAIRDELAIPSSYPRRAVAEARRSPPTAPATPKRCRRASRSSRSIRSARWTWTRPCTWPGTATAIWCTTRSPTWPRSSRPAARWRPRPGGAAPPCTARTPTPRCTRSSCPREPPACCRTGERPAVLWTIRLDGRGSRSTSTSGARSFTSVAQLNYPAVQADADAGTPASVDRTAAGDRPVTAAAVPATARDQPGHPGRGDRPAARTGTGRWSCGRSWTSSSTTPRSAC